MKFDVRVGDLTVEARFADPAFALMRPDGQKVVEILLKALAPYGASPDGVFYTTEGSLANRNVTINTPRINGGVKVFVSKVEAGFNDLSKVRFADIKTIVDALFDAVQKTSPGTSFASYGASLNYHGIVGGMSAAEFIRQYVTKVPELGPATGSAAGLYYGRKEPREFVTIVMDASTVIPNALFIRTAIGFDGKKLTPDQLPAAGAEALAEVLAALKLEHDLDLGK